MNEFDQIEKEEIPQYHCVTFDVLDTTEARAQRMQELEKAMILGNGEHVKYKIHFVTTEGVKEVQTTVWATTDNSVTLKGGIIIPIHCIQSISYL